MQKIVYTKFSINVLNHNIGTNQIEIQVLVYNDTQEYSKSFTYLISGSDYLLWESDNYIFNYIQSKLRNEIF